MMYNNEQLKSDGNCEVCRRRSYCSKSCSAFRRKMKRVISGAFANSVAGAMIATAELAVNNYFKENYTKE